MFYLHFQQYFRYFEAVSFFIGKGNQSTRENQQLATDFFLFIRMYQAHLSMDKNQTDTMNGDIVTECNVVYSILN